MTHLIIQLKNNDSVNKNNEVVDATLPDFIDPSRLNDNS